MNRMHEFPSRVTTIGSPFVPCSARKTKVSGRNRTRERGIVYQILEYRYREQKSQLFPSNPLQPLRNFLETSLSKHCSHYFASIYANIIERNEEKFEIFRIYFSLSNWILKKHLSICWNVSTCIAHRSENSINFHQVSTYRQSLLSLTLTLPQTTSKKWQEARIWVQVLYETFQSNTLRKKTARGASIAVDRTIQPLSNQLATLPTISIYSHTCLSSYSLSPYFVVYDF